MPTPPNPPDPPSLPKQQLIDRPKSERLREYKYRFAQTLVFGMPVVVLAIWGAALGPTDQMRWSSVMQALLTGWILYINLGLALEAIIRRQFSVDLLVFAVALLMYLWSLAGIARVLVTGHLWPKPLLWICVTLLGVWNLIGLTRLRATD